MEKIAELEKQLDTQLSTIPAFQQVERQTGIRKTHIIGMAVVLFVSSLLSFVFPGLVAAVLSLAYPMYATACAADGHDKAEDVQWLSYWLCYGLLHLASDIFLAHVLHKMFSPFVLAIGRSATLVFLYAPQTRGATLVWHRALRPVLHVLLASCPGLSRPSSSSKVGHPHHGGASSNGKQFEKKRADVAKTLNEMRNRSKSGSGDEAEKRLSQ